MEFFKRRDAGGSEDVDTAGKSSGAEDKESLTSFGRLKAAASKEPKPPVDEGKFVPGSHVRHEKYGKGLVLRREGSGDNVKLTVSVPGFGQKKLIEKFARLESA